MSSQSDQGTNLNIAKRPLGSNGLFEAFADKMQHHDDNGNIELMGLTQLDGEYIVMVAKNDMAKSTTSSRFKICPQNVMDLKVDPYVDSSNLLVTLRRPWYTAVVMIALSVLI